MIDVGKFFTLGKFLPSSTYFENSLFCIYKNKYYIFDFIRVEAAFTKDLCSLLKKHLSISEEELCYVIELRRVDGKCVREFFPNTDHDNTMPVSILDAIMFPLCVQSVFKAHEDAYHVDRYIFVSYNNELNTLYNIIFRKFMAWNERSYDLRQYEFVYKKSFFGFFEVVKRC